jgi:2-dehydropantoate 2-reductase
MKTKKLDILVIGAGGIGGITAVQMHNSGFRVEVVDNMPGLAEQIQSVGIKVFGNTKPLTEKLKAYTSIKEVTGKKDVIMIATKATALCAVSDEIKPLLKDDSVVISMQNGICEEYLLSRVGKDRVIGCVVGWGATVHEPGILEKTSDGAFSIGTIDGASVKHLDAVIDMLGTTAPVEQTDNILGSLYSKLIINSCITTLGAICGMTLGKMLAVKKIRNIFIQIIREAVGVGRQAGIKIEKYAGSLDFYSFAEDNSRIANFMKHLKIRIIGLKYRRLKSSSLQSLETGRKTEIDFLNGYISQKGRETQTGTPLNDLLVHIIKEIEEGKREISFRNFEHPYLEAYA